MTTLYKVCVEHSQENCKKLYDFLKSVGCIHCTSDNTDLKDTTLYDYTQDIDVDGDYCCILVEDNVRVVYYGFTSYLPEDIRERHNIIGCNVNDFINSFKRRVEL